MAFRRKNSKLPRSRLESFISGLVRRVSQTSSDSTNRQLVETWRIEVQRALWVDLSPRRASNRTNQMWHGWETHWSTRRTFGNALSPISTSNCRLAWRRTRIWGLTSGDGTPRWHSRHLGTISTSWISSPCTRFCPLRRQKSSCLTATTIWSSLLEGISPSQAIKATLSGSINRRVTPRGRSLILSPRITKPWCLHWCQESC